MTNLNWSQAVRNKVVDNSGLHYDLFVEMDCDLFDKIGRYVFGFILFKNNLWPTDSKWSQIYDQFF